MQESARHAPVAAATREIVERADFMPLALSVVQATKDLSLLKQLQAARNAAGRADGLSRSLKDEVYARAVEILESPPGEEKADAATDEPLLAALVELLDGRTEGARYAPMILDQAGFAAAKVNRGRAAKTARHAGDFTVAVIGAGMSGICAAIELRRAGIDFEVFERGNEIAGTWAENTYPGCGVDTPSLFYSYSFEARHPWQHHFAKRDAIAAYFEHCVDKHEVRDAIHLESEVRKAEYDEARQRWVLVVRSRDGVDREVVANAVITAVGQLNIPSIPKIEGLDQFAGTVAHTALWPDGLDVKGQRVGLIGTGASGMQVGPAVAPSVAQLTIFQREPHWVLPNAQYHEEIGAEQHWLMEHMPYYAQWVRAQLIWSYGDAVYPALQVDPDWVSDGGSINATSEKFRQYMLRHLRSELADRPDLLAKATPGYPPYSKRVLLDNHWFKTLKRPNVELVTDAIAKVAANGVVTADGQLHELDVLVLATGFQATRMLSSVDIRGRAGITLRDVWHQDDPRAYLGVTVPQFPNLFMLYGPNTNLGYGGSAIFNTECQVNYIVQCFAEMRARQWATLECRPEVHDAYNRRVDDMHASMVWARQDVDNWYRNSKGRVATNSPWRLVDYWAMTRRPDFSDFIAEESHASATT